MSRRTSSTESTSGSVLSRRTRRLSQGGPVARRGAGVEELDAAAGDDERGGGELAVVLEVQEVVAELLLGEPVGRRVEVVGELPDGAEVGLLGAFAEPGELEVLVHPPTERGGHGKVLSQRGW